MSGLPTRGSLFSRRSGKCGDSPNSGAVPPAWTASLQCSPPACGVCPRGLPSRGQPRGPVFMGQGACEPRVSQPGEALLCVDGWAAGAQSPSWYKRPAQGHTALRLVRSGQPGDRRPKRNCWQVADEPTCLPDRLAWAALLSGTSDSCASAHPRPRSVDRSEDRTGRGSCWKGRLWGLDLGGCQPVSAGPCSLQWWDPSVQRFHGRKLGRTQMPPQQPPWVQGGGWAGDPWGEALCSLQGPAIQIGRRMTVTRERGGGLKPITSRPAGVSPRPCPGEGPRQC